MATEVLSAPPVIVEHTSFHIGRYEIHGEIGRGTMGIVYEAFDPSLDRSIALKTFHLSFAVSPQQYKSFEHRFFAEARIAARLSHPGIVTVHDVGCDPEIGTLYIALEYLEGRTLQNVIEDKVALGWREALGITRGVAEALHYAHAQQVVHRDIKPANIMLLPTGHPKIMDFGIARMETSRKLTTCQVFGTPLFMAPEQALGHKPDGRADLFSLGSIAYTLLTGRLAFDAPSIPATVRRLIEDDPSPPSEIVEGLPRGIDEIFARVLAKKPQARYANGLELADDIQALLDAPRSLPAEAAVAGPGADMETTGHPPEIDGEAADSGFDMDAELAALVSIPAAEEPRPAARLRGRPGPLRLILPVGLAALSVCLLALRAPTPTAEGPVSASPASPSTASPSPVPPSLASPPTASVPSLAATAPSRVETRAATRPTVVAAAAPRNPAASGREPAKSALGNGAPIVQPARLRIDFEHPLRSGTLRIWIDSEMVLQQALESQDTTGIFGLPKGRLDREVTVKPGEHAVRAEVTWDGNDRQQTLSSTFEAGSARLLEINLGRLRKNLSLEWK